MSAGATETEPTRRSAVKSTTVSSASAVKRNVVLPAAI